MNSVQGVCEHDEPAAKSMSHMGMTLTVRTLAGAWRRDARAGGSVSRADDRAGGCQSDDDQDRADDQVCPLAAGPHQERSDHHVPNQARWLRPHQGHRAVRGRDPGPGTL